MNSKRIKFTKEFCFTAVLENAGNYMGVGLVDFQIPQNDLFIKAHDGKYKRLYIPKEEDAVLVELHMSYGRSLLRIDMIDNDYISFTLLEFSGRVDYDESNPLRIVVDQAISADLRTNNIDPDSAVEEIKKQILVNESGTYAFAYSTGSTATDLELIGDRYTFTIAETPQHYLHIIQIRRRTNKQRIDSPLNLLCGSIEVVNELTDRAILTAKADAQYKQLTSSDADFIELWNLYNDLELESIKQQATELGFLKYKSFRYSNGLIIFVLDNCYTRREFCADNMYYVAIPSIDPANPMDYNFKSATVVGTEIDYSCVNTPEFRIKEDMDTTREIPRRGYLLPSISGSAIQKKRRDFAESSILSNKCKLPGLKNIIQGGTQVGVIGKKNEAISSHLEEAVFEDKDRHLTEKQKEAIKVAINTPDIAIIQGPPGTGKTTVIKAIVKRIDELWDSKAKILITSTQHDAVDNAVEEINYGGVPVNRVSIRKGQQDENLSIYGWIDQMIGSCESWLDANDGNSRSLARQIFEKLVRVEETTDYQECKTLLEECYQLSQSFSLSIELHNKYALVMGELGAKIVANNDSGDDTLSNLIHGQRLSREAYLDDGVIQLKQLEQYIKFDGNIDFEIPSYWKKLRRITQDCPELDEYLVQLKTDCSKLEEVFCTTKDVNDELLYRDIKDLVSIFRDEIVKCGDDKKTELSNYIWEFKQELTNSSNVDQLIKAYSKINAATCQQSANPHLCASMAGFDEEYDYVIVDEAARSNPLDLLIPMSMGKKIILVGDHKQLPHMVEKNVVDAVANRSEKKDVQLLLKESLFMRLNTSVSKEDIKLGISRTAMLTEQYRMHPDICDLVNIFYEGQLETLCKREERNHDLGLYEGKALKWIDMPICDQYPAEIKHQSVCRQCEVDRINEELTKILSKNSNYTIGIIAFYSAQAKLLNDMVRSNFPSDIYRIRVGTVDAFQGKEFDVVLLSIVRANRESDLRKRVGFLDNDNRLCVAFSRAKRLLVAVGDSATVASDDETVYVPALNELYKRSH